MEYQRKTLYELIQDKWAELDGSYARLLIARENICDFFRPDLGVDYDESHDMLMLGGNIYEGSGPWVARTASTSFQGHTCTKKYPWFKHQFSDDRLLGIDELDEHAENITTHLASVYQRGNFYDTQWQFILDAWTIGSPLHFIEEDPETGFVMCLPQHWRTYRIFYDKFNRSEGVIICDKQWTAKQCFDKFTDPNQPTERRMQDAESKFSQSLYNSIHNGRWNDRFTIWRAVFKSTDPIWHAEEFTMPLGGRRWYDVYYEDLKAAKKNEKPLLTGGYYSKPFVHYDYDKKPWEISARTPAFAAMYDNLSLQQIFKAWLEDIKYKARPAMAILDTQRNRTDFSSEGENFYNRNEWNYTPKPIERTGDIRFEPETMEVIRANLSRHFSLDTFRMFSDLAQSQKSKDFRVLQLMEMAGERVSELLPTIESHENYLAQVDERVREIETRAGRGPFNRAEMENVFDIMLWAIGRDAYAARISPEFIGTLRKVQQIQQALKPIQYGVAAASEIGSALGDPNLARFMIKGYDTVDDALRAVGFSQKLVNERENYDQSRAQFEKMVAADKRLAQFVELMKASRSATNAIDPTSIIGQLTGATA